MVCWWRARNAMMNDNLNVCSPRCLSIFYFLQTTRRFTIYRRFDVRFHKSESYGEHLMRRINESFSHAKQPDKQRRSERLWHAAIIKIIFCASLNYAERFSTLIKKLLFGLVKAFPFKNFNIRNNSHSNDAQPYAIRRCLSVNEMRIYRIHLQPPEFITETNRSCALEETVKFRGAINICHHQIFIVLNIFALRADKTTHRTNENTQNIVSNAFHAPTDSVTNFTWISSSRKKPPWELRRKFN